MLCDAPRIPATPLWEIVAETTERTVKSPVPSNVPARNRKVSLRYAAVSADEHRKIAAKKRRQEGYPSSAETLCGPPPADSVP